MMDIDLEKLATAAATTAVKEIITGGIAAGKGVWSWIKGKASSDDADDVAKIEAAPEKPSTPDKLKALLKDMLYDAPELQQELARVLEESGGPAIEQVANVTGDGNIVGQQAGDNNKISVKK